MFAGSVEAGAVEAGAVLVVLGALVVVVGALVLVVVVGALEVGFAVSQNVPRKSFVHRH